MHVILLLAPSLLSVSLLLQVLAFLLARQGRQSPRLQASARMILGMGAATLVCASLLRMEHRVPAQQPVFPASVQVSAETPTFPEEGTP